jgi:superoxide oxidase
MHWIIAAGMVGVVGSVKMAQNTDDKQKKGKLMHFHKSLALVVAALIPLRLGLRITSYIPKSLGHSTWEKKAGELSHLALYGMMIGLPVSGITMGWYSGYGLPFFWTKFKGSSTPDKKVAGTAYKIHSYMGKAFFYFVPVHIGGAYFHVLRGQPIFPRINPFRQSPK